MLRPLPQDLFGEVPVTRDEVRAWLLAVPRIDPDTERAAWYVEHWDVPGKVRAAKLAGTLDQILARAQPPAASPAWLRRFTW